MDPETITSSPSANISLGDLSSRLAKRVTSPAAPAPVQTPAATATPPENQPPGDGVVAPENPTAAPEAGTETAPAAPAVADPNAAPENLEIEVDPEDDHAAAAELEAQTPKPSTVKNLLKRVHTVVDQRDQARTEAQAATAKAEQLARENAQLNERLQAPGRGRPPISMVDRYSSVPEVAQLDEQTSHVNTLLGWIEQNPDGGEMVEDGKVVGNYTAEQVRAIRSQAETDRIRLITERTGKVAQLKQAEQAARAQADATAQKAYPWLLNKTSPEFQVALEIGREIPGLMENPRFVEFIGDATAGRMARLGKVASNRPGPMTRPKGSSTPPAVTTASAAAPRVDVKVAAVTAAAAEYKANPTLANYQRLTRLRSQAPVAKAA